MYGIGILKGLWVTLKHFFASYIDDLKWIGRRYYTEEGIAYRSSKDVSGIFTIQYPEEKLPSPEEFRFMPFLVYDINEDGTHQDRCTSCGICAKVCPPQCIWIEQTTDPETGRPVPEPVEFFIDIDICMNCGYCAEYCPFDAIIMDHDYELATFDRHSNHIYNKKHLSQPAEYYREIRPQNYQINEDIRVEKEAKKQARAEARAAKAAAKAAEKDSGK